MEVIDILWFKIFQSFAKIIFLHNCCRKMATSVQTAYTSNTNALVATNLGALGTPSDLRRLASEDKFQTSLFCNWAWNLLVCTSDHKKFCKCLIFFFWPKLISCNTYRWNGLNESLKCVLIASSLGYESCCCWFHVSGSSRFLCAELRSAGVSTTLNALRSCFTNRNCKGKHWLSAFKVVWRRSDVHFTDVTNVDWKTTRLSRACLLSNVGGAQLLGITNAYQSK